MIKELDARYLVLKYSDIDNYLDGTSRDALIGISNSINYYRSLDGKDVWKGLCISEEWPEYETVEKMLLDSINSKEAE